MGAVLGALFGLYFLDGEARSAEAMCPSGFARPGDDPVASCQESAVPESIVALARAYLAEATNSSYQQAQYVLLQKSTSSLRVHDCQGAALAYEVNFEYAPLRRVDAESARIGLFVPVDPKCPASGFVAVRAVDGTIVEPKLSRAAAVDVARRVADPLPSGWAFGYAALRSRPDASNAGWHWDVHFRGPTQGGCFEQRKVVVDAITGNVLGNTVDASCY